MKSKNKPEMLLALAKCMDNWPKTRVNAARIPYWHWHRSETMPKHKKPLLILRRDHADVFNISADTDIITKAEWLAQVNAPFTNPVPGGAIMIEEPLEVEAMIDIETFDTTNESVVFQAAIVIFDKNHGTVYQETWNLDIDEQLQAGRTVSASTMAFHLGIPANALSALKDRDIVSTAAFAADLIAALILLR